MGNMTAISSVVGTAVPIVKIVRGLGKEKGNMFQKTGMELILKQSLKRDVFHGNGALFF
jgi:hypothetical protein